MNKVILIGRLTRDPELRYGEGSTATAVCKFTLAVDRRKKDDPTDFLNIVAFGGTADVCGKYLSKGRQVAVDGRIQTRSYENKDGKKVNVFEIVAESVDFVGSRNDQQTQAPTKKPQQQQFTTDESDEDLPWD